MNLLYHLYKNFDQLHWTIQWAIYIGGIVVGCLILAVAKGRVW
jgi:hypothetical protein